jgi:hypothetical protein
VATSLLRLTLILLCAGILLAQTPDPQSGVCQPVQVADLQGLDDPYVRKVAPDGSPYCEGLLPKQISLPAPQVVSAVRDQGQNPMFKKGTIATLQWCDDSTEPVHVQLRSIKPPLFALDAQAVSKFRWSANTIAKWQPDWTQLKVEATRPTALNGARINLLVPVTSDPANADTYTLMFQSEIPVYFDIAYLEPVAPAAKGTSVKAAIKQGAAKDIWTVRFSLSGAPEGIIRVTLEESRKLGGVAKPFYFLHKSCGK